MFSTTTLGKFGREMMAFYSNVNYDDVLARIQLGLPAYGNREQPQDQDRRRSMQRFLQPKAQPVKAMDRATALRLIEAAAHESGHVAVAYLGFGFPPRGAAIEDSGAGAMYYRSYGADAHSDAVISLAGGIAAAKAFRREHRWGLKENSSDENEVDIGLSSGARYEAQSLVNRLWPAIVALTRELCRRKSMDAQQLKAFFARWN